MRNTGDTDRFDEKFQKNSFAFIFIFLIVHKFFILQKTEQIREAVLCPMEKKSGAIKGVKFLF